MNAINVVATIDRFERDQRGNSVCVLVFDDGEQLTLPVERLPEGSHEGSVLTITIQLDDDETQRRRTGVRELQSRLFHVPDPPDERTR